ncbi:MAG: transposase [Deltaproteobacteria bacterium]|nr:transposase [Deltaproteobacteria bacterium]
MPRREPKARYKRNLPHVQAAGKTFFITFRTIPGVELNPGARSLVLGHCLHDHGRRYELLAAVVMPDHVHLLLTPRLEDPSAPFSLAAIMSGIKGASAHSVNRLTGRRGQLWQDESFDHIQRSEENARKVGEYISQNPVRKGLAETPDGYPWLWRRWVEGERLHQKP